MKERTLSASRGFTLVEALVSIAVIVLLVSIVLAAVARLGTSARDTRCLATLRQLGFGLGAYHADHALLPFVQTPMGYGSIEGDIPSDPGFAPVLAEYVGERPPERARPDDVFSPWIVGPAWRCPADTGYDHGETRHGTAWVSDASSYTYGPVGIVAVLAEQRFPGASRGALQRAVAIRVEQRRWPIFLDAGGWHPRSASRRHGAVFPDLGAGPAVFVPSEEFDALLDELGPLLDR